MACSTCGKSRVGSTTAPKTPPSFAYKTLPPQKVVDLNCQYTLDQVKKWSELLICFKENGYYSTYNISGKDLNKALGIVLSAINYPTNICYFESELNNIFNIITIIVNSGKC